MKQLSFVLAALILISCQHSSNDLKVLFKLPKSLKEVSGITYNKSDKLIFAIQDRGNNNEIQVLNLDGKWIKSIAVANATNVDWEDITQDKNGNLYIGDFGNNKNDRQDLCIYKVSKDQLSLKNAISEYKIAFSYPQQADFPPKKINRFYDLEGFIEMNGAFYLFTKNRSKNFDGTCLIYKVENREGSQEAKLMGSFTTCDNYNHCAVTSAAISPDGTKMVVLCQDKIILFDDWDNADLLSANRTTINLNHFSQKEAVTFLDDSTLLIADERDKTTGGNMYKFTLKN